jgi:hypothetical protein
VLGGDGTTLYAPGQTWIELSVHLRGDHRLTFYASTLNCPPYKLFTLFSIGGHVPKLDVAGSIPDSRSLNQEELLEQSTTS